MRIIVTSAWGAQRTSASCDISNITSSRYGAILDAGRDVIMGEARNVNHDENFMNVNK